MERLDDNLAAAICYRPDLSSDRQDLTRRLFRALAILPAARRAAVKLHVLGYHRHEIAEVLGWTEAKTRNLLYRGLADLRARLGDQLAVSGDS